ncbi:TatD family hydrolase [Cellulosimicrobium sp. RS]|uniref:TatD family hydrolase n=1 Tax=Cellulosimicrobium sp. RS TaxID=3381347 RepID=UPI0038FCD416
MTNNWPPFDMHAHVDINTRSEDLLELRAVIFAATRSLAESRAAVLRQPQDLLTVWGVGTHPAVKTALETFDQSEFADLVTKAAFVAEVGLDAKVKARLPLQQDVLAQMLCILQSQPRLTSLHSYGATNEVVELLEQHPIDGVILHWWLGDAQTTAAALDLGAYFSVNPANLKHIDVLATVPLDRLLPETDHPSGDRFGKPPRVPGNVSRVEQEIAKLHGLSPTVARQHLWSNLKALTASVNVSRLLPERVAAVIAAAS